MSKARSRLVDAGNRAVRGEGFVRSTGVAMFIVGTPIYQTTGDTVIDEGEFPIIVLDQHLSLLSDDRSPST